MLIFGAQLTCSVCRGGFDNKVEWLGHLLQEGHQVLAREELLHKWGEGERACSMIVLGAVGVGEGDEVIQFLGAKDGGINVQDFVFWPAVKPKVGVVRFRSRKEVEELVASFDKQLFRIEGSPPYQAWEGGKLSEVKWKQLLPQQAPVASEDKPDGHPPAPAGVVPATDEGHNMVKAKLLDLVLATRKLVEPEAPKVTQDLGVRAHLNSIRKLIEISDDDYKLALEITRQLQEVLIQENERNAVQASPSGCTVFPEVVISRHWSLKLQYSPVNKDYNQPLVILISNYAQYPLHRETGQDTKPLVDIDKIIMKKEEIEGQGDGPRGGRKLFLSTYEVKSTSHQEDPQRVGLSMLRYTIKRPLTDGDLDLPFKLNIVSGRNLILEVQLWRLLKYYCSLEPIIYPVMSVLFYWVRANSVTVGELRGSHNGLPDPSGLNWLLMLFLQKEGLIPTPRVVQTLPHGLPSLHHGKVISVPECEGLPGTCKKQDGAEAQEDKVEGGLEEEQFAQDVFKLLCKFFKFCNSLLDGSRGEGTLVLNTRDAEIIPLKDFLSPASSASAGAAPMANSKLTRDELQSVQDSLRKDEASGSGAKIIMLHPFFPKWRISVTKAEAAFAAMKETEMRLTGYLEGPPPGGKNGGVPAASRKVELEKFLELFKIGN